MRRLYVRDIWTINILKMENDTELIISENVIPLAFLDEELCTVLKFWSSKYEGMDEIKGSQLSLLSFLGFKLYFSR